MKHNSQSNETVEHLEHDISADIYEEFADCKIVAIDIETSGLDFRHDSIASVQVYCPGLPGVMIRTNKDIPIRLSKLVRLKKLKKIFHYAPFDLGFMYSKWNVLANNVACTKTASRILDPNKSTKHGLAALIERHLGFTIDKSLRMSDWTTPELTDAQIDYAMNDVLYLHELHRRLSELLVERNLLNIAEKCFSFIPARVFLDHHGFPDIFLHDPMKS